MTQVILKAKHAPPGNAYGHVKVELVGHPAKEAALEPGEKAIVPRFVGSWSVPSTGQVTVELDPTSELLPAGLVYRATFKKAGSGEEELIFAGFSGVGPVSATDFVVMLPAALPPPAADALFIRKTEKAAANGVATLGADSKIPAEQLPPHAVSETFTVATEAAMLALTAQRGDVAVRTDVTPNAWYRLIADAPTVLANWLAVPAGGGADNTKLPLAGGTLTGPLVLAADPVADLHPATRKYADAPRVLKWPAQDDLRWAHVAHGKFWAVGVNLGSFWWEAWVKVVTGAHYWISEGYGGAHAVLIGWQGTRIPYSNFSADGAALTVPTYGDYLAGDGEWLHDCLHWDGTNVYRFVNGIPIGRWAYTGTRQAQQGTVWIGGSHHANFLGGSIAMVRGFEGATATDRTAMPRAASDGTCFAPAVGPFDYVVGSATELTNRHVQPAFCTVYETSGLVQPDLSPGKPDVPVSGAIVTSAARTVTATGTAFSTAGLNFLSGILTVTAASGTTPTLDVILETSEDGGTTWTTAGSFNQKTGVAAAERVRFGPLSRLSRWRWTIAGTTPSFTFSVIGLDSAMRQHPGVLRGSPTQGGASDVSVAGDISDPTQTPVVAVDYGSPLRQGARELPTEIVQVAPATPTGAKVFDSFSRRNQTRAFQLSPTLGSTEAGSLGPLVWQQGANVFNAATAKSWGILGGKAVYLLPNSPGVAFVEVAAADMDVRVTRNVTGTESMHHTGILFRGVDFNDYWALYTTGTLRDATSVSLTRYVNGVATQDAVWVCPTNAWSQLRVTVVGDVITGFCDNLANGWTQIGTFTSTVHNTGTKAGLFCGVAAPLGCRRYDDFTVL